MASKKLTRLALLLPAAVALVHWIPTQANAVDLSASDYVSKILAALSSGDLAGAHSLTNKLRHCGVDAIIADGSRISLAQIDYFIHQLKAGNPVTLPGSGGEHAFVVGSITEVKASCDTPPPVTVSGSTGFNSSPPHTSV